MIREDSINMDDIIEKLKDSFRQVNPNLYLPKILNLRAYGEMHEIWLNVIYYMNNGNLYIRMMDCDGDMPVETWSVLTVNLDAVCDKDCAYIDIYNNGIEILDWIKENELGVPTGIIREGYPEYRFKPEVLSEIDPYGYGRYLVNYGKEISPVF